MIWCCIRSWELFGSNVSSQIKQVLGVHLLEKCTFLGYSRPSELLFLLKHLALS